MPETVPDANPLWPSVSSLRLWVGCHIYFIRVVEMSDMELLFDFQHFALGLQPVFEIVPMLATRLLP
jgi:hypothetical protein